MTWTDDLDPLVPTSDGPAGQGDDEIRLLKSTLVTTWPELGPEITMGSAGAAPTSADITALWDSIAALSSGVASVFTKGMIVLWNTANGAIPTDWTICNGDNVNGVIVPNMEDRFPIGASATRPDGSGGGADGTAVTDSAGAHTHGITNPTIGVANLPSTLEANIGITVNQQGTNGQQHDATASVARGDGVDFSPSPLTGLFTVTGANSDALAIADALSDGAHTHTLTQAVPSYIAFTYICYVGPTP
jgi:hypothetical protein